MDEVKLGVPEDLIGPSRLNQIVECRGEHPTDRLNEVGMEPTRLHTLRLSSCIGGISSIIS